MLFFELGVNNKTKLSKNQGGRRYFSRREITALVGGPGNMAVEVNRHILVITPTAKVLPPKNEKLRTAKTYRRIALRPKKCPHTFVFSASANQVPATLDTAKMVPPTLDIAQKVPPILDAAEKVPRTLDTVQKVWTFFSCSFFVLR